MRCLCICRRVKVFFFWCGFVVFRLGVVLIWSVDTESTYPSDRYGISHAYVLRRTYIDVNVSVDIDVNLTWMAGRAGAKQARWIKADDEL